MTTSELHSPDSSALRAVEDLCGIPRPYASSLGGGGDTDRLFARAMREIVTWHAERSEFYRRLLELHRFHPEVLRTGEDCAQVPWVPAGFFKKHEVLSVPRSEVTLHLTSSGTTGQKSQMFFDEWSIRAPQRMVDAIFEEYGWITPGTKTNYLLYTYETEPDSRLGTAYTDHYLCRYAPVNRVFSALRLSGSGPTEHEFDCYGCIETLRTYAKEGLPVRIFGFPAFLEFTLKRMKDLGIENLHLHPESLVFLGGGWKGHAPKAGSLGLRERKLKLYLEIRDRLGIPDHRLRDGFGSVEHCIPYVECEEHRFHVPVWARVFVRDARTLRRLPYGQKGLLQFVSPYITSVPAHSVLMGDWASLHEGKECPCPIGTPFFEVHGRAGTSVSRSCAAAAAELLEKRT